MNKYKQNWILFVGGALLSLALLFMVFSNDFNEDIINSSRNPSHIPLLLFAVFALIVAPILEEIAFRGYFSDKNYLKRIAIILLLVFVAINYENLLAVTIIISFLFSVLSNKLTKISIVLAALAFASLHFKYNDEISFSIFSLFLSYFSGSLLLIWVTLNFSLKRSIIIHVILNASFMIMNLTNLQFPNEELRVFKTDDATYQIHRVPFFSDHKSSFAIHKNSVTVSKMSLRELYRYLGTKTNKEMLFVKEYEPYMKYNIDVHFKNDNLEIQNMRKEVVDFLEDQNFIILESSLFK